MPHFGRAGQALFVSVGHEPVYLFIGLVEALIHASVQMIGVHAVQPRGRARHLRIVGAVYLPKVEVEARYLVVALKRLGKGVPVEFLARVVFDEFYAAAQLLNGVLLRVDIVVVAQRNAEAVGRQLEVAILERGGHDAAVAGHVAGDEALAEDREVTLGGDAGLGRRQGAYVRRNAEVFYSVEIHRRKLLVYHRGQEDGDGLHRDADEIREAGHELGRNELVKADDAVGKRLFAADVTVGVKGVGNNVDGVLYDDIVQEMPSLELHAAHALELAVYKLRKRQVGQHPAIAEYALDDLEGRAEDEFYHVLPHDAPPAVVDERVLYAAPFAPAANAGLVYVGKTQISRFSCHVSALPLCVSALSQDFRQTPERACAAGPRHCRCTLCQRRRSGNYKAPS